MFKLAEISRNTGLLSTVGSLVTLATTALLVGCGTEVEAGPRPLAESAPAVLEGYRAIVRATYGDTLKGIDSLNPSVNTFLLNPSEAAMAEARQAWLDARTPYGQSEAFRFYGGPIDDADGPEARINAWPLDEAYIDYVDGDPQAGVINDPVTYPKIDTDLVVSLNEMGGEKNISVGYHAIEFLLWGQDKNVDGPGNRPFTDYVMGAGGTAANQDRRRVYLSVVTQLLVTDFEPILAEWGADDLYGASFVKLAPEEGLRRMLLGMGSLSGAELAGERMQVAYDTKEQEDEHSCFSDNTLMDLVNNARSIQNVYLGKYGDLDVPGIDELVRERDPALDKRMQEQLAASIAALEAIPGPFDRAIIGDDTAEGRTKIAAAIKALREQTTTIVEIATLLGITLNIEE